MQQISVCGQCCVVTNDDEYGCPEDNCDLVLCPTCSNPEVHFREDGSCPPWWGEGLTEEQVEKRMREAAEEAGMA